MIRRLTLAVAALLLVATTIHAQNTFTVTVATKTAEHPWFGQGSTEGYVVDGVQGKEVVVMRGAAYTFQMSGVPAMHPFYISTSEVGAGMNVYNDGVTGNFASGNATLTLQPSESAPDLLYYQCGAHDRMGGRIVVQGSVSSVSEEIARNGAAMMAWPNPAGERTTIALTSDAARRVRVVLYDNLGRIVGPAVDGELRAGEQWSATLDVASLPSGAYVVHASGDGVSVAVPIAVQR